MPDNQDIVILSGEATVTSLSKPSYQWAGRINEDRELIFKHAYKIERRSWDRGIENCFYRVHNREFKDLSCMSGDTLQKFPDDYEIREHADGTKFMFSYGSIPTFDSADREWDSMCHTAVYCDDYGINMIRCRHGYKIPHIEIYLGLIKSIPGFSAWLKLLGCDDRITK